MPLESLLWVAAVALVFATFATAVIWAERQSRTAHALRTRRLGATGDGDVIVGDFISRTAAVRHRAF